MEVKDNRLVLGGRYAEELTREFQSPLFVYEEDTLRRRAGELFQAIDYENKEIKYACKANTNIEIMKVFRQEEMGIDAVSPGEIYAALKAGFDPSAVLFTTNNAAKQELEYALSSGVMLNIDSLSQLEMVGRSFPGIDICVRINPDVGAGHHGHVITGGPESKFGIDYTKVDRIKEISKNYTLSIKGIHQHMGSGILDVEMFKKAMDVLLETAEQFTGLDFIDFGGGLGVPYGENEQRIDVGLLGEEITRKFEKFCGRYGKKLRLVIEPGRYLVAESGFLLALVTAVKEGQKHRFAGVDTGFHHLIRPAMYGSFHRIVHAGRVNSQTIPQVIAGNLCESGDTLTRDENGIVDRELPLFREGDIVCITNAGAYGYSMASNYNSRPRPAEVMVKDGRPRLIRKRETIEDIFKSALEIH
ncbi:MAG: diaminopimelate decarboxylase [Spirochaetota bacterium]